MSSFRVPLAAPVVDEEGIALATEVLRSGQLTMGPVLARFERTLERLTGAPHAAACSNGTAALHLALWALDVGPGDEVVVPAYTFPATANVVGMLGATVRFCDTAPGSDVAGAEQFAACITERTRALVPVHLFGNPAPIHEIVELAGERGIAVVEDAAGAVGTTAAGTQVGTLGTIGCLSFHPRKTINMGEGGAVLTADPALDARLRRLRHHGLEGGRCVEVGANYRLSDINAAVAIPQLERLDELVAERERQARWYDEHLADIAGIQPPPRAEGEGWRHSWQAYVALLDDAGRRIEVIQGLADEGVQSQIGTYFVPGEPAYADAGAGDLPKARDVAARGLALPLFPGLTTQQQEQVVAALDKLAPL